MWIVVNHNVPFQFFCLLLNDEEHSSRMLKSNCQAENDNSQSRSAIGSALPNANLSFKGHSTAWGGMRECDLTRTFLSITLCLKHVSLQHCFILLDTVNRGHTAEHCVLRVHSKQKLALP